MLYAVFGRPGSGKSYFIVEEFIVKRIVKSTIISNVKLADGVELPNYNYLDKSGMDELHAKIKSIMEDGERSHDEKKHQLAEVFGAWGEYDITLIVDECHLYGYSGRSADNRYLDQFISIHRHTFPDRSLDLVLITQVPSRLNGEISEQVEEAVIAIPAPQRIVSSFLEYKVYGSVNALKRSDKTLLMRNVRKKGRAVIFELYESGYKLKGSGDFRRKLVLYLLVIGIGVFYTFHAFKGLVTGDAIPKSHMAQIRGRQEGNTSGAGVVVDGASVRPVAVEKSARVPLPHEFVCRDCNLSLQQFRKKDIIMLNGLSQIVGGRVVRYCFWTDLQKRKEGKSD